MKKQIVAAFIVFTILLSAPVAMAQEDVFPSADEVLRIAFTFIFGPDFPSEWLTWQKAMQLIFFPFIALLAVFYGIMSELHIFRSSTGQKMQLVIAVVMALVAGKAVLATMRIFLIANAWLATVGFGIIMIVGIFFWAASGTIGGIRGGWGDLQRSAKQAKSIDDRINEIDDRMIELFPKIKSGTATHAEWDEHQRLLKEQRKLVKERRKVFAKW